MYETSKSHQYPTVLSNNARFFDKSNVLKAL